MLMLFSREHWLTVCAQWNTNVHKNTHNTLHCTNISFDLVTRLLSSVFFSFVYVRCIWINELSTVYCIYITFPFIIFTVPQRAVWVCVRFLYCRCAYTYTFHFATLCSYRNVGLFFLLLIFLTHTLAHTCTFVMHYCVPWFLPIFSFAVLLLFFRH